MTPSSGTWTPARAQFILVLVMLLTASLSIAVSQIALGLALVALLWRWHRDRVAPSGTGLGLLTLAVAGWALINIPFSGDQAQSMVYYRRFFLFTTIWVTAMVADDESRRSWLLHALVGGAVILSVVGLARIQREVGAFWMVRLDVASNPMTSGCLLMMPLLAMAGFILIPGQRRLFRGFLTLAALPVAFAFLQTMTRSAWIGFAVGLGVIFLLVRPRLCGALVAGLVVLGVVVEQLPDGVLRGRLVDRLDLTGLLQQNNTRSRLEMWGVGLKMIKDRPLLGWGDRDIARISMPYYERDVAGTGVFGHLHSNPIMLAVIWGLPGFALVAAHFLAQLILLWRSWRRFPRVPGRAPPLGQGWVLGAIGVWAGFLVAGLTEWYFGDAEPMLMYFAIMGIALGARTSTPSEVGH